MGKKLLGLGLGVPKGIALKEMANTQGKYFAGTDGEIYCFSESRRTARLPKPFRLASSSSPDYPYPAVAIILNGRRVTKSRHVLVCTTFHGPKPSATHEVRHLDGDHENGIPSNLKWGTPAENEADKRAHGRVAEGSKHGIAKLNEEAVRILRIAIPRGLWNPTDAAKVFGVGPSVIRSVVSGRSWKHVL